MRTRRAGSDEPKMRTARSPALRAPPIDTVATGTPAGICTIDRSESRPSSRAQRHRHADHRQRRRRRDHARQVRRTARTSDDDLDPPARRGLCVLEHANRCAMRRHHAHLERDVELGECKRGVLHHRPVAVTAHDDADPRSTMGLLVGHAVIGARVHPTRPSIRRATTSARHGPLVPGPRPRKRRRPAIRRRYPAR